MADAVRIGVSLPQSGRDARSAWAAHYNAYRLWLDARNRAGGLLGRPVELVVLDDGTIPGRAVENYQRLIHEERVDLLFAPARSRTIEQVAPLTEQARRLMLVGHGSAHAMFQQGRRYLFLGWPGTDFDVPRSFFEWTATLPRPPRRLAVLRPYDPRPTYTEDPRHGINQHNAGVVLGAKHFAQQFGVEVVADEEYRDSGFDALFSRVRAAQPDMVIVANYALQQGDRQLEAFIHAYRESGLAAHLWLYRIPTASGEGGAAAGSRDLDPREVRVQVDPVFEGAFSYEQFDWRSPNPLARAFVDAFLERNDYLPDGISAGVYVCCQLLEQAVSGAGTTDNEVVRSYLLSRPFETIMGTYHFHENGVPAARMLLTQCQEGEMQVVHPPEERTAPPRG